MNKVYRISIPVVLVAAVGISLFIKARLHPEQKMGKYDIGGKRSVGSVEQRQEDIAVVGQEQKQIDSAGQSADTLLELFIKKEAEKKLPTLLLVSATEACPCTLRQCQQAEAMVDRVIKQFPGKIDYRVIDCAEKTERVKKLTRQYKLGFLPAALFFDGTGRFVKKIEGFLNEEDIMKELSSLAGSTE